MGNYKYAIRNRLFPCSAWERCFTLLSCLLFYLLAPPAESAFLDKPGVRPQGMGGAFVARADDTSAGLWNPAGLAQLKQSEIVANYSTLYTGLYEYNLSLTYLGYTLPVHWSGALGLNFIRLQSPLYSETTVLFSYSQRLRNLYLGANVKGLFANFSENEYTQIDPLFQRYGRLTKGVSFDLGVLLKISDAFSVGLAAQNLNQPNLALEEGAESILPREIKTGISFRFGQVYPSLDFTWRDTTIRDKQDINIHFGVETLLPRDVSLRTGINLYELTAGASYRVQSASGEFQIDYAFNHPMPFEFDVFDRAQEPLTGTSGSHQFSISVRFDNFLQLIGTKPMTETVETVPPPRVHDVTSEQPSEGAETDIASYQQILRGDKGNIDAHFHLGQLFAKAGQYQDAIQHLKRAVTLAPNVPKYRYALAVLYKQYGDMTGRRTWYNKAIIEFEKTHMLDENYKDVSAKIKIISKK